MWRMDILYFRVRCGGGLFCQPSRGKLKVENVYDLRNQKTMPIFIASYFLAGWMLRVNWFCTSVLYWSQYGE